MNDPRKVNKPKADVDQRIGQLAVRLQMLTQAQVQTALAQADEAASPKQQPGQLFLELGLLKKNQLNYLLRVMDFAAERLADRRFGDIAIARGWVTQEQIEAVFKRQEQHFAKQQQAVMIGELLVREGLLTEEQRDAILHEQRRLREQAELLQKVDATAPSNPAPAQQAQAADDAAAAANTLIETDTYLMTVSPDRLQAFVTLIASEQRPELEALRTQISEAGIKSGIDSQAVARLCEGDTPAGEAVRIAQGTPAKPGQDGFIEYLFDTAPLKPGTEADDGSIDFKERGKVPEVAIGETLARRTPAVAGENGLDVFGQRVRVKKSLNPRLWARQGAKVSEDRLTIIATAAGQPRVSATGTVSVFTDYVIDGDVDYETGHVDYGGRVVTNGTVRSGFRVHCGELVAREIEAAEVKVQGNIILYGGIMGASVEAGGRIKTNYIRKATVNGLDDIIVRSEILDSKVTCGKALMAQRCVIYNSEVSAKEGIFAKQIGTEASPPCKLTVGNDDSANQAIAAKQEAIAAQEQEIATFEARTESLKAHIQTLNDDIQHNAQIQDRGELRRHELQAAIEAGTATAATETELAQLQDDIAAANQKLDELFADQDETTQAYDAIPGQIEQCRQTITNLLEEIDQLQEWLENNPGNPLVQASEHLLTGTVIQTPHVKTTIKQDHGRVTLTEHQSQDERGNTVWRIARRRDNPAKR